MIRRWDKSKPPRGPFTLNRDCLAAQGLVLWYPIGAHGSKAVYDLVGTNHPGTLTALTATLGTTGEPALAFANGSSSIIQSSVVPVYTAPLSIAVWARKDTASDTTGYGLAAFGDYTLGTGSARRFQFDTYGGDVRWLAVGVSAGAATKGGIVSGRWHHMMGVDISSTSRYAVLDGVAGAQNTTNATPGGTQNRFTVGSFFDLNLNQGHFNGQIGEVCIWNRSTYEDRSYLADPGRRFELWYPLRSRKWFSAAGGSAVSLVVADSSHAHTSDALTLTSEHALAIADVAHAHTSDGLTLTAQSVLAVADAAHAHTSDNVVLGVTGATDLVLADATHGHTVDAITLTTQALLAIQDALHAHASDNLDLSGAPALQIASALHAHTSDGLALTVDAWLVVADALHAHLVDAVVLTLPGAGGWDGTVYRVPLRGVARTSISGAGRAALRGINP